ncbi:MAG TPA: hypothetical protein ENK05_10220 [Gammaproteobacteria bacterium]|nr:hypothetical protein [Gammaproteobacteria bacterium]
MESGAKLLGIPLSQWGADEATVRARLAQSSFVSERHRYLYVEVPKAACTSIKRLIHRVEGLPPIPVSFDRLPETRLYMFIHDRQRFPLPSLANLPPEHAGAILQANDWFRFTFVRNPYSRLVSAWKNKLYFVEPGLENTYNEIRKIFAAELEGRYIGFDLFARYVAEYQDLGRCNPHYRLQKRLIFADAIPYDYIGRVENFGEGIMEFHRRTGTAAEADPGGNSRNRSDPADWRSHYTEQLAELVYQAYAEDFEYFGYDKDSWRGGEPLPPKTASERYLEDQIFERNRLISQMYQWINARSKQGAN